MGLRYEPALDGLRGVAVLLVIGVHTMPSIVQDGYVGVDVFFVLSGYLITSILAAEIERFGKVNYLAFMQRRARRILPAFALFLGTYALLVPVFIPEHLKTLWSEVTMAGTFTMNLFHPNVPLLYTWSLGVEAQFYLAWPFILPLLLRWRKSVAIATMLLWWFALTAHRIVHPTQAIYFMPPFHMTGMILGSAFAIKPVRVPFLGWLGFACLLLVAVYLESWYLVYDIAWAELASVAILSSPPSFLTWRPLVGIGIISYGVYLWHGAISFSLHMPHGVANFVATLLLTLAAASASYWFVERRYLRRRPAQNVALATTN